MTFAHFVEAHKDEVEDQVRKLLLHMLRLAYDMQYDCAFTDGREAGYEEGRSDAHERGEVNDTHV